MYLNYSIEYEEKMFRMFQEMSVYNEKNIKVNNQEIL